MERNEEGQSLAYLAVVAMVIMALAAFTVDLGLAHVTRAHQSDMLQQALSKCSEPATTLLVKNASEPGKTLCTQLTEFLRDEGYDGEITAYYYEPTAAEMSLEADRRIFVYGAKLTSTTDSIFGTIFGTNQIDTSVRGWTSGALYATQVVYKPAMSNNVVYRVASGAGAGSWSGITSISGLSDEQVAREMRSELDAAASHIN